MHAYRTSCNCFISTVILKYSVSLNDFTLVLFFDDFCMYRGLNLLSIVMLMNLKRPRPALKTVTTVASCQYLSTLLGKLIHVSHEIRHKKL